MFMIRNKEEVSPLSVSLHVDEIVSIQIWRRETESPSKWEHLPDVLVLDLIRQNQLSMSLHAQASHPGAKYQEMRSTGGRKETEEILSLAIRWGNISSNI